MENRIDILKDMLAEINSYNGTFEDLVFRYDNLEDVIEYSGKSGKEIARATYFGDIKSWSDDYFFVDVYGNFASCSESEYNSKILYQEDEIIEEFINIFGDNLEDYQREWLETLGIEVPEGSKNV